MDRSVIPFVFFLCSCWTHVEGAVVLPPTNVTLLCHNMKNTLQWGYDQLSDGLKFKVTVSSLLRDRVILWVDSPDTSIDLSDYSDPANEYMVSLAAVKDGVESEPVPEDGIEYSYFKDAPVTVKCSVDLPLFNVNTGDKHLHFSFTHPGLLYPTSYKARKRKSSDQQDALPDFDYHIEVINQKESHHYHCSESVCQGKIPVHDSEKSYCLNITGEMKKISVQATKNYCSEPWKRAGTNPLVYIVPITLTVLVLIGAMICFKMTRQKASDPRALNLTRGNSQNHVLPQNDYCSVYVDASSPETLTSPNEDTSNYSRPGEDDLRLRLGMNHENEPDLAEAAGAQGALEKGYTDGRCLDEEEEEAALHSSYEPRDTTVANNHSGSSNM